MRPRHLYALLSALVPGLGQLVAGRWRDAAMLLFAACWLGLFLMAADPSPGFVSRLPAFFLGAPAIEGGSRPLLVVFTALLYALRWLAAWSLLRRPADAVLPDPEKGRTRPFDLVR